MYTGTEQNPMFSPSGPFVVTNVFVPGGVDHLTISEVPEPSTWAMMALGFAGLGFARYRTSRRTAPAA
jgi:PEP-CTERM motif